MFGLLSKKPAQPLAVEGPKKFTRFDTKQPQTRFPVANSRPSKPQRPVERMPVAAPKQVLVKPRKIDENAHLYADAKVSVSILRKALPQRFKKINPLLAEPAS